MSAKYLGVLSSKKIHFRSQNNNERFQGLYSKVPVISQKPIQNNSAFVFCVHLSSVFEEIVVRSHAPPAIIIGQQKQSRQGRGHP